MGMKDNYPLYTTNFWGNSSENNYGFGNSNIQEAISNHSGINQSPLPVLNLNQNPMQPNVPNSVGNNSSIEGLNQNNVWAQQRMRKVENGLLMDSLDTMYGMNRAINGISFGGLDWLGNKLGYDTQMTEYLKLKDERDRNLAQSVGQLAEYGGGALTGGGLANTAQYGYNQFLRMNGRRNLVNQLQRGNNFSDIYMGKIDKDKLRALNNVRRIEGAEPIVSRKATIPKDRVQHIYEERILGDRYTPEDASNTIYDALFNSNSQVQPSRYRTLQKFESPTPNRVIVGKIRNGNNIFVKTGYKK